MAEYQNQRCVQCNSYEKEALIQQMECQICFYCKSCLKDKVYKDTNNYLMLKDLENVKCRCEKQIDIKFIETIFGGKNQFVFEQEKAQANIIKEKADNQNSLQKTFFCPVCIDNKPVTQAQQCPSEKCNEKQCKECLEAFIKNQISQGQVSEELLCCYDCKNPISHKTVKEICPDLYEKFLYLSVKDQDGFKQCPTTGCKKYLIIQADAVEFHCDICNQSYCPKCDTLDCHKGMTCDEYKKEKNQNENDFLFQEYMKQNKIAQCPVCHTPSAKETGCSFLTCNSSICKRKTYFCYLCNAQLTQKEHYSHFLNSPYGNKCHGNTKDSSN